jgi:dipeptidyl aminopeptidase/acylaminoacyl peptidase
VTLAHYFVSYSGPGSQLVLDEWKMDFNTYMASGLSYLVLEVDGSGSGGQGEEKVTEIKNKLGQLEVQDQLDATK